MGRSEQEFASMRQQHERQELMSCDVCARRQSAARGELTSDCPVQFTVRPCMEAAHQKLPKSTEQIADKSESQWWNPDASEGKG